MYDAIDTLQFLIVQQPLELDYSLINYKMMK